MKRTLFLIVGLAISALCLWFVLRRVEHMDQLLEAARTLKWQWVALCTAVFYGGFYLRALRWANFFPPTFGVRGTRIFGPMMMGYALNSLFPGRIGEPGRAVLVARRESTGIPPALSSVVAERLVDMATLLVFLVITFRFVEFGNFSYPITEKVTLNEEFFRSAARNTTLFLALPLTVIIILMMSNQFRNLIQRIIEKLPFLPEMIKRPTIKLMHAFALGFEGLKTPRQFLAITLYSLLIWGSGAWCIDLLAPAFGIEMTVFQAAAIMIVMCVAIMLPATPGYWGLYEAGFIAGAKLLGIEASDASLTAMALLLHLIQYVPIVLYGLIWAFVAGISLKQAARSAREIDAAVAEES